MFNEYGSDKVKNPSPTKSLQRRLNNSPYTTTETQSPTAPMTMPTRSDSSSVPTNGESNLSRNISTKRSHSADAFRTDRTDSAGILHGNGIMWSNEIVVSPNSAAPQPSKRHNEDRCGSKNQTISDLIDIGIRVALVFIFIKLERTTAFRRQIHMEELWLYKNPRTPDIVSTTTLLSSVIIGPFLITLLHFFLTLDRRDFRAANWAWTLALGLNGITTSLIKISVGRPRPDFFYRCFPDGVMLLNDVMESDYNSTTGLFNCTGNVHDINEGYKSFPSGHASFSFTAYGFISFYIASKLHAFHPRGRGETWRLCIAIAPLMLAMLVAISRTADYHHHWQDVVAGSLLGLSISYITYRQYYPSIFSRNSHRPFYRGQLDALEHQHLYRRLSGGDNCADNATFDGVAKENDFETAGKDERCPLICDNKPDNKWI